MTVSYTIEFTEKSKVDASAEKQSKGAHKAEQSLART